LAKNGNLARGFNAQADFATVDIHDRDADLLTDMDLFTQFPAQYQHIASPCAQLLGSFPVQFYFMIPKKDGRETDFDREDSVN
jgi:hypothetical protein